MDFVNSLALCDWI